jgi:hypothetical protein
MNRQQILHWITRLLSIVLQAGALVFVAMTLLNSREKFFDWELLSARHLFIYLGLVILLAGVVLFVILAYWRSLRALTKSNKPSLVTVVQLYGRTILAKYIPGNVFHYLGRQVVGRELGLTQVSIAGASVMEVLLLTSSSSLVAMISANSAQIALLPFASYGAGLLLLALMTLLPLVVISLLPLGGYRLLKRWGFSGRIHLDFIEALYAYIFYLLYVIGNSLILIYLHTIFIGSISVQLGLAYFATFSISFLVSYLTPGAPGGLGVREALFILLLANLSPQSNSAIIAVAHRFASLGAQVLYAYGVTPLLGRFGLQTTSTS